MFDAIRVLPVSPRRCAISPDRMVNSAVARQTKRLVRIPAGRRRRSRSMPIVAPSPAATVTRRSISWRGSITPAPHRPPQRDSTDLQFELRQFRKVACSGVYLTAFQMSQPIQPKLLDGEAAHHGAVYHRAAQRGVTLIAASSQIAHESARKAVTRARGIVRFLQRERRHAEYAALVHHHRAILAALYHQCCRPHFENMLCRPQQIMFV